MKKFYKTILIIFYGVSMVMQVSAMQEQKERYAQLQKTLGYDPQIKTFHHLRRLLFDLSEGETGKEFFSSMPLSGFIHGEDENGDYAYEYSIQNKVHNLFTFDFPKYSSEDE